MYVYEYISLWVCRLGRASGQQGLTRCSSSTPKTPPRFVRARNPVLKLLIFENMYEYYYTHDTHWKVCMKITTHVTHTTTPPSGEGFRPAGPDSMLVLHPHDANQVRPGTTIFLFLLIIIHMTHIATRYYYINMHMAQTTRWCYYMTLTCPKFLHNYYTNDPSYHTMGSFV